MSIEQVIIMIYSYIMHEDSRLESACIELSKFVTDMKVSSVYVRKYYEARLKYDHFREFERCIYDILRYYDIG